MISTLRHRGNKYQLKFQSFDRNSNLQDDWLIKGAHAYAYNFSSEDTQNQLNELEEDHNSLELTDHPLFFRHTPTEEVQDLEITRYTSRLIPLTPDQIPDNQLSPSLPTFSKPIIKRPRVNLF